MKIYEAINNIMADIEAVKKDKKNPQQGYNFRGIDDMYNALHPLFSKHKVFITSKVLSSKREERQTKSGGNLIYSILLCEFNFYTFDGSFVTSQIEGEAMDSGDKSTNKALSTALKYAVMQMFLIPTIDLVDSDSKTFEVKSKIEHSKDFDNNKTHFEKTATDTSKLGKPKEILTQKKYEAMHEFINKNEIEKVLEAMKNYEIKKEWVDELNGAIEFQRKLK